MRTGRLILAVAMLLALAGCAPAGQHAASSPTARATPIFASDAEALAAAEKAYAAYLKVSDQILKDGGNDPDRLLAVATMSVYKAEAVGYASAREKKWRSTGGSQFSNMTLQDGAAESGPSVIAHVCTDISAVDVLDARGISVVSPDRSDRTAFEISFVKSAAHAALLVSGKSVWDGGGVC